MPATYDSIATTTLGSATNTITFSSIPNTYTDLKLVLAGLSTVNNTNVLMRLNSNTSSVYSATYLIGTGSAASSSRYNNLTYFDMLQTGFHTTNTHMISFDFLSYAGSTNKTILQQSFEDNNGGGTQANYVMLYRNTSAISTISVYTAANNFAAGTMATIYGILRA